MRVGLRFVCLCLAMCVLPVCFVHKRVCVACQFLCGAVSVNCFCCWCLCVLACYTNMCVVCVIDCAVL